MPEVHASTDERISRLPITGRSYRYWSVYRVTIPDLQPQDVVHCHAQAEVTTPHSQPVQVVRTIARTGPAGLRGARRARVRPVTPLAGENVTRARHHVTVVALATDRGRSGSQTYALVLQAATVPRLPGASLKVEQGYGGLWCLVFRAGGQ